jgi:anaerobic selenocysteine-containing dehydrogenase
LRLAELYTSLRPGLIKICDGINRNFNGGQAVRAVCALPALTAQYGLAGGGLAYSVSGYVKWDDEAINKWQECPAPGRMVNMNRIGAALLGEVVEPPIKSLFVFGANPVTSSPNAASIIKGLLRGDLFTVVHELFMTDTADYADIVLPATSQLEQTDLHKAYGNPVLTYNRPAIPPLGESKSNWEVMGLLAQAMGYDESWLHQDVDSVIDEVLKATASQNSMLRGLTPERFKTETTIALNLDSEIPFAGGRFSTPSGNVELFSQKLAEEGIDPLPSWKQTSIKDGLHDGGELEFDPAQALQLVSGAAHHFVSSSFANQKSLLSREGSPFVEINPADASQRGILHDTEVVLENGRGWVRLKAKVTEDVRPGVVASPKGRWQKLSGGRNINFVTSDLLADMAGQSTFHSTFVWLRPFS